MSHILIINSSARKHSNSSLLSAQVAAGAQSNGHTVETIETAHMQIAPCRGCQSCLQPNSNFCVIKDDMHLWYEKIQKADMLVFSSPIYWFNMCGQLKQFIDRCFAIAVSPDPQVPSCFASKKIGTVLVYGEPDPLAAGAVNAMRCVQDICAYTGATWAGAVHGAAYEAGTINTNTTLLEQAYAFGKSL